VVTSVRLAHDQAGRASLDAFAARWARDGNVHVHDTYVSNADFDTWLAAADVVVLPYVSTYSSGVAARAKVLGRRILASRVGGLPEQLGAGDVSYGSDAELKDALRSLGSAPA
jgi:glycosyltransferase involved in cell wall biosynthesis